MNTTRTKATGWLLVLAVVVAAGCNEPNVPNLPDGSDEEEAGDGNDEEGTAFDFQPPAPFYLV